MKERTLLELHDPHIGHKKFAKICDLLIANGYEITDIKEFNEKFKFKMNNHPYEYQKCWKSSAKEMADYFIGVYETAKELAEGKVWRF